MLFDFLLMFVAAATMARAQYVSTITPDSIPLGTRRELTKLSKHGVCYTDTQPRDMVPVPKIPVSADLFAKPRSIRNPEGEYLLTCKHVLIMVRHGYVSYQY